MQVIKGMGKHTRMSTGIQQFLKRAKMTK